MVHLVLPALERLLIRLRADRSTSSTEEKVPPAAWPPQCQCNRNPYREFYVQGERAILDSSILGAILTDKQMSELRRQFRAMAIEDIRSFDSLCLLQRSVSHAQGS